MIQSPLGIATECVNTTFFYTSTSHTLCQQSDETLFGHFVIALNTAFTQQLLLADEGYENGSDTIDLPTPLQKTPQHTPCFQLGTCFIQPSDHHTSQYTTNSSYPWMMNTGLPKKHLKEPFCIHKHGLLHNLCQYPCPYENYNTVSYMDSLDLSDISDYDDYMVTSSDEEILGMEEVPY